MGLRLDSGFRKLVDAPITKSVGTYLQHLDRYGVVLGLESSLWRQSREALLDVTKGNISNDQFLDLCTEYILQVNEQQKNSIGVIWTLRSPAQEHSFRLKLIMSQIPHFQGDFLESSCEPGIYDGSFVKSERYRLAKSGVADVAFTKEDLSGAAHYLYLDSKITRSKALLKHFRDSVWAGDGLIGELADVVARELMTTDAEYLVLRHKDVNPFLDHCDGRLVARLGTERFAALIAKTGLALSEWLQIR